MEVERTRTLKAFGIHVNKRLRCCTIEGEKKIFILVLSFTFRSAPLYSQLKQWAIANENSIFAISVSIERHILFSPTLLLKVSHHSKKKRNGNTIRIMPFAIDLKFIYEPLTSDSYRPTFRGWEMKKKKSLVFHAARTLTYAMND